MTLKIVVIVLVLLIVALYIATYIIRKKYYRTIDELDAKKAKIMKEFPIEKIQSINHKSMTGQSQETAEELKAEWDRIETKEFPMVESLLFEAEQATDRYRFKKSGTEQEAAEGKIREVGDALKTLNLSLDELMKREEDNLKKIENIKKRYHTIRKELLAKSFSFGRAVDALEENLGTMEHDFSVFSNLTAEGDHEEANQLLRQLEETIDNMETLMEEIPELLTVIDDEISEQVQEIEGGYQSLKDEGYVFPDDSIKEDLAQVYVKLESISTHIGALEVSHARSEISSLEEKIDQTYDKLELEIESREEVKELTDQIRKIFHYLKEQNRKLFIEIDRLSQSYVLNHEEAEKSDQSQRMIETEESKYMKIAELLAEDRLPFSEASQQLNHIFDQLETVNDQIQAVSQNLKDYRNSELEIKADLEEMENAMREMKRYVESKHLPGLPGSYLDFFFYTTDHIEQLSQSIAAPKLDMKEVFRLHEMCEDDVEQLAKDTDELVDQAVLSELVSQRLYRHKTEHSEVLETIKYSRNLFSEEYDYETSLKMVREKLEAIEPGAFQEVKDQYLKEKNFN